MIGEYNKFKRRDWQFGWKKRMDSM